MPEVSTCFVHSAVKEIIFVERYIRSMILCDNVFVELRRRLLGEEVWRPVILAAYPSIRVYSLLGSDFVKLIFLTFRI